MIQYHHEKGIPLPVNIIFCFEGMEESGSDGLDDLVRRESTKGGYFEGVDCVCIVRMSINQPCVLLKFGRRSQTTTG